MCTENKLYCFSGSNRFLQVCNIGVQNTQRQELELKLPNIPEESRSESEEHVSADFNSESNYCLKITLLITEIHK